MFTMHPTLLIGAADWDAALMPRAEFDARIAALWQDHPHAKGAIVYGEAREHAALAYLTNFTPKLEAAIALIPRDGAPRLLIGGGVNMLPAAKPLTFVTDLAPLRGAGKAIGEWAGALAGDGSVLLIGGEAMPYGLLQSITSAVESGDAAIAARMQKKRARELVVIRQACATLDAAVAALRAAQAGGSPVTDCVLAAEHAALARHAQDVRSLFSLDGGLTLRPFDVPVVEARDPLQVYLAVRQAGYWAEAFVRVSAKPDPLGDKARALLRAMLAAAKPGATAAQLQQTASTHPLCTNTVGSGIGLALDAPPLSREARLAPGGVYSLRAGLIEGGQGAIASAMIVMTDEGHELLWAGENT
jgi:hypothetical protein